MVRLVAFCLFLCVSVHTLAADIVVKVQNGPLYTDDAFTVQYSANTRVDAPDFSPLKEHFEILDQQQSSNQFSFNGSVTAEYIWQLKLVAKEPGDYVLPAIFFGSDKSDAKAISIKKLEANNATEGVIIEAKIDTEKPTYVQQQIIFTVDLFVIGQFAKTSVSEPTFSADKVLVVKMKNYENLGFVNKNGLQYQHYQAQYAIFPQLSGDFIINSIRFVGHQYTNQRRSQGIFFRRQTTKKRVHSKPIELNVRPQPESFKGSWVPAKTVQILETWSQEPPEFTVGESITRTLDIMVDGLTGAQLPELNLPSSHFLKQYPDQPATQNQKTDSSIIGTRTEKIAYVPTQAGTFTLPAIKLEWWNTATNSLEKAQIPSRVIEIKPSAAITATPQVVTPHQAPIMPALIPTVSSQPPAGGINGYWLFTSVTVWGLTLLAWWWHVRLIQTPKVVSKGAENKPTKTFKAFQAACKNQQPEVAYRILLQWGAELYGDTFRLKEFEGILNDDEKNELLQLQSHLYAQKPVSWNGCDHLLHKMKLESHPAKSLNDQLVPLYKG